MTGYTADSNVTPTGFGGINSFFLRNVVHTELFAITILAKGNFEQSKKLFRNTNTIPYEWNYVGRATRNGSKSRRSARLPLRTGITFGVAFDRILNILASVYE
jgi:hypothetical protein